MFKRINIDMTVNEAWHLGRLESLTESGFGILDGEISPFTIAFFEEIYDPDKKNERSRFNLPVIMFEGNEIARLGFRNKDGFMLIREGLSEQVEQAIVSRCKVLVSAAKRGGGALKEEKKAHLYSVDKFMEPYKCAEKEEPENAGVHLIMQDEMYNIFSSILPDLCETVVEQFYIKRLIKTHNQEEIRLVAAYYPYGNQGPYLSSFSNRDIHLTRMFEGAKESFRNDKRVLKTKQNICELPISTKMKDIHKIDRAMSQNNNTVGPFSFQKLESSTVSGILVSGDVALGTVMSGTYEVIPHGVTAEVFADVPDLSKRLDIALLLALGLDITAEISNDRWIGELEDAVRTTDLGYEV